MRKVFMCFLSLIIMCNLFGCAQPQPNGSEKGDTTKYSLTDIMVHQSVTMAQQIGLCAQSAYIQAMKSPATLISTAEVFTAAAENEPTECQIITTDDPKFGQQITHLMAYLVGSSHLGCSSILTHSTLLRLPQKLSETTVLYLRYSDSCHVAVVFVPGEDRTVSATAYPLFADVAEALLKEHFAEAEILRPTQIKTAEKNSIILRYFRAIFL